MKWILGVLVICVGCGSIEPEGPTDEKSAQHVWIKGQNDGKANHYGPQCTMEGSHGCTEIGADCCEQPGYTCQEYTVYDWPRCRPIEEKPAPLCGTEGPQGCDIIGADCCDSPGTVCEEYTVYDWPRCRVPQQSAYNAIETDTRGGIFACSSAPEQDFPSPVISIVGSNPEFESDFEYVNLAANREALPGLAFDIENSRIEDSLAAFEWDGEHLNASTYYYDLRTTAVAGFDGIYRGEFVSKISDDVWQVNCWEPWITPTARYDELNDRCIDVNGQPAQNPTLEMPAIRATEFAECMDFEGVAIDEGVYGYQEYKNVSFAGSDLSGAALHFAHIRDANFSGADLSTIDYGYANLTGTVSSTTTLPIGCDTPSQTIDCWR